MQTTAHKKLFVIPGLLVAFLFICFLIGSAFVYIIYQDTNFLVAVTPIPFVVLSLLFIPKGFRILQPNTAVVATFLGNYSGTLDRTGFYWFIPFYQTQIVSLRQTNFETDTIKVNDSQGNPIEVAASVVYKTVNPAASLFDVEDAWSFLLVQADGALRALVSHHPYASEGECLSRHSDVIIAQFEEMLQERVEVAGIKILEARFTHLAYAAEIAQVMLRRQQAEAVVAARQTLVHGAISMIEDTIIELRERGIVEMSGTEKAVLVTNMLSVLLSEEAAAPVLNVGR